jgi:hypothetical protein
MTKIKMRVLQGFALALIVVGSFFAGRASTTPEASVFCRESEVLKTTKTESKTVDFPGGQVEVEIEVEAVRVP